MVLAVLFFVLELIFRALYPEDALRLAMGDIDLRYHHSLKPNSDLHLVSSVPGEYDLTARINNFGFRGPDIELGKKPGQLRIFVVGDSFTFGSGARDDETIPALLQKSLDPTGESVQVINVGTGSYSPVTHYLRLRDQVPTFRPDLVLMLLDFSDLRDDWDREKNLLYDRSGNITGSNPYYEYGKFQLWNYLRSKSVFCKYIHNKVVRTVQKIKKLGLREYIRVRLTGGRSKAAIAKQEGDTIEFDGRLFMRGRAKAEEIRTHFKRTGKFIMLSRDVALQNGAQFILVMYPYGTYVGPDQWAEGRKFWGFESGKVDTDLFAFDLVRDFAADNGIPFINLLNDFVAHKDEKLFFDHDGHFTPRGNEVAKDALITDAVFQEALAKIKKTS